MMSMILNLYNYCYTMWMIFLSLMVLIILLIIGVLCLTNYCQLIHLLLSFLSRSLNISGLSLLVCRASSVSWFCSTSFLISFT